MARVFVLEEATQREFAKGLSRSVQSGHLNFLLGSGASLPAIPAAGQIENEIAALSQAGNDAAAQLRMYEFLTSVRRPTNSLIADVDDEDNAQTLAYYAEYIHIVESILTARRTTLLPKQATIFTTNYDLFLEKASVGRSALRLNDGFSRAPSLNNRMEYSSRNFFTTTYNTGNLYAYKVEIPSINLIKLHGSLSWEKDGQEVICNVGVKPLLPAEKTPEQISEFLDSHAVVLPQATKFRTTLMDRTYYELLRIYANELDRENCLLVAFGFSFGDEHIRDITRRALRNPTLRLLVFAFNQAARNSLSEIFAGHTNVEIVAPAEGAQIGFGGFNQILRSVLPVTGQQL